MGLDVIKDQDPAEKFERWKSQTSFHECWEHHEFARARVRQDLFSRKSQRATRKEPRSLEEAELFSCYQRTVPATLGRHLDWRTTRKKKGAGARRQGGEENGIGGRFWPLHSPFMNPDDGKAWRQFREKNAPCTQQREIVRAESRSHRVIRVSASSRGESFSSPVKSDKETIRQSCDGMRRAVKDAAST